MHPGHVVSPRLVGRADVLEALRAALRDATTDGPRTVLLTGEAGIGKTRLLTEFTGSLGGRARTVEGGCAELGGDGLPYAPFTAVLRRLIRDLGTGAVAEALPGPELELARWFPRLGPVPAGNGGRHRLYEEVLALVERAAADRPLVLAVEDVHWADASTRELLAFLARNLSAPGVLLVATYRSAGPADTRLVPLLSELRRAAPTTELRLERLTRREVAGQLTALLGVRADPGLVRRVHERSDGNPLFVEALARTGDRTPDGLRDLLLHGPRELPERGRRVLRAAAVAGGRVEHRLLETVVGESGAAFDEVLRELVDAGLLIRADDGYDFRHALIRQAVYEDLLPGERIRLHTAYASALRDAAAPAELAAHAYAAGDHPTALDAAWRAALAAGESYAYEEAVRQLDRVLELWDRVPAAGTRLGADRVDVWTRAAESCMLSGDYPRGTGYATAGLTAVGERAEPARAARLLECRGRLRNREHGGAMDDFARALALLPDDAGDDRAATVTRGRLLGLMAMGTLLTDTAEARRLGAAALAAGRATGEMTVTVRGLLVTGLLTFEPGMLAEAAELTEAHDDHDLGLTTAMYASMHHLETGDSGRAAEVAGDALRLARRLGMGRSRGALLAGHAARALIAAGHWERAGTLLGEALEDEAPRRSREILLDLAGHLALMRGDAAAAREAAEEADTIAEALDEPGVRPFHRYRLGILLAVAEGDGERADRILGEALADPPAETANGGDVRAVLVAGALAQRARTAANADAAAARLTELAARAAGLPAYGALAGAWQAMLDALTTGDDPDGWRRATAAWRGLTRPWELASCLRHGAVAAAASGDGATAAAWSREADAITAGLGAVPHDGEPAPRPAGTPPDDSGLTPREREVLALMATGLSNRRIAGRLYISPSTAGVHVSHILAKLGAATRTEASAIAHRRGLLEG